MEFLKNNKRFSFKYGGVNIWDCKYTADETTLKNELTTVYCFENGLKITNIAKKYDDFGAYEWVNYVENTGSKPTDTICELWDCDVNLPIGHEEKLVEEGSLPDVKSATKIYAPKGSNITIDEFLSSPDEMREFERINHLYPGKVRTFSNTGGRSSDGQAPFFNVHKNGKGYIFAVGWTGQWNVSVSRTEDELVFKSKIEDTNFYLLPGEKYRTSSVVILPYEGDFITSQNIWRRFVKKHFTPKCIDGKNNFVPLSSMMWGGISSKAMIEEIDKIKKKRFPYEYFWVDAGWYGINTDETMNDFDTSGEYGWSKQVGDWRASKKIHPNGLVDVSKAAHNENMKFLLWFEIERSLKISPIMEKYSDYYMRSEEDWTRLLNLGDSKVWEYAYNTIADMIEKVKIDCYRQDFNMSPISFWRYNDTDGRNGITEIKYINGLYKLLDALLERFPNLLIDNCASGGKRLDIEMMKRSIPLWHSDCQCIKNYDVQISQCHNMNYHLWLPYFATTPGEAFDEYRMRSAYAAGLNLHFSFANDKTHFDAEENDEFIRKYANEFLKLRPYFSQDFYPLTEYSQALDAWCVMQFDRPEENDGIIQVFRRENSPHEAGKYKLYNIDESCNYKIQDIDGGEYFISGKELRESGISIHMPQKRSAKIFIYTKQA